MSCVQCRKEPLCAKEGVCLEYRRLVDAVDEMTPHPSPLGAPTCTFPNCKGGQCCMNPSNARSAGVEMKQ